MNHESSRNIRFLRPLSGSFMSPLSTVSFLLLLLALIKCLESLRSGAAVTLRNSSRCVGKTSHPELYQQGGIPHPSTPSNSHHFAHLTVRPITSTIKPLKNQPLRMQQWPSLVAFQSHLGRLTIHPFIHKLNPTWLFRDFMEAEYDFYSEQL